MIESFKYLGKIEGFQWDADCDIGLYSGWITQNGGGYEIVTTGGDKLNLCLISGKGGDKLNIFSTSGKLQAVAELGDYVVKDCSGIRVIKQADFKENYDFSTKIEGDLC